MRDIKYFCLNCNNYIRLGEGVDPKPLGINLKKTEVWYKILGKEKVDNLISKNDSIYILIPTHNSPHLETTVESIVQSQIPDNISIKVIIVTSACRKKYIFEARSIANKYTRLNIEILIINQPLPGKPLALNTGIKCIQSEIIVQLVDDCTVNKDVIPLLFLSLAKFPEYGAATVIGKPSNLSENRLLMQVQKIHHDNFYINDQYSLVGRGFVFRKSFIPELFPENIMSEDYWLEMIVRDRSKGFLIIDNAFLYYRKPSLWKDYLRQIDRFDSSFKQLKNTFPNLFDKYFGGIKSTFKFMLIPGIEHKNFIQSWIFYFKDARYPISAKFIYILIIIYQIYYLKLKNKLFPLKSAVFQREGSTFD